MASKVIVTKNKLNAIGDAIRAQTGENEKYTLDEMPKKICKNNENNGFIIINDPLIYVDEITAMQQNITISEIIHAS